MYDTRNERFWFPVPENQEGKIGFNSAFLRDRTYTDIVTYTDSREDYTLGHVIPAQLLRDMKLPKTERSRQIKQLMFELVPVYGGLEDEIGTYGITHSPLQSLEKKRGVCTQRTSIGAAIARVNDVPYRIVAHQNLAPDINSTSEWLVSRFGVYFAGRVLSSPKHILFPPLAMYRSPYPHKWLEVYEDGQWVTVDTIEWNPTTFLPFRRKVKERFVCKEMALEGNSHPDSG